MKKKPNPIVVRNFSIKPICNIIEQDALSKAAPIEDSKGKAPKPLRKKIFVADDEKIIPYGRLKKLFLIDTTPDEMERVVFYCLRSGLFGQHCTEMRIIPTRMLTVFIFNKQFCAD